MKEFIDARYAELAAKLGDTVTKIDMLSRERDRLLAEISTLNATKALVMQLEQQPRVYATKDKKTE